MGRCTSVALLAFGIAGCGGGDETVILRRWSYEDAPGPLTPPGVGPDRRVLVVERDTGRLVTLEEVSGKKLEGPYDTFPSAHAPVAVGADLYLVSLIGRVVRLNLAGETLPVATVQLGRTGPIAVAADGAVRVAATSGRFVVISGETVRGDTTIDGAAESSLGVGTDSVSFAATDTGKVIGIDGSGAQVFAAEVHAPASGPSTEGSRVAVGELDGVAVFERSEVLAWRAPRAARVVGTAFIDGDVVAWGEDGKVERYDSRGQVSMSFTAGPPIYAPVIGLPDGKLAVFDSSGKVHRVTSEGVADATFDLGGEPSRQITRTEIGFVVVTVGNKAQALQFDAEL